ncbi:MAG: LysM peptidoglycan-binding domain-containing protein [Gammaproteobacteria bacterium]|nr:LysM peptidoglycan-binding domain-containing protein [Gammaproteobacteria bacterium]
MALTEKWKTGMKRAIKDTSVEWDKYDGVIKKEVSSYAKRFPATKQWNYKYIKAMVWIESGGPYFEKGVHWRTKPMQIGRYRADPAYGVLVKGGQNSDLIMSTQLKNEIKKGGALKDPKVNIKAGIAYLYTMMIKEIEDVFDSVEYEYKAVSGDNLSKIAKKCGTTIQELKNRSKKKNDKIAIGESLKYRKLVKRRPKSFKFFTAVNIANNYNYDYGSRRNKKTVSLKNGKKPGDPYYHEKITYLIKDIFPKRKS